MTIWYIILILSTPYAPHYACGYPPIDAGQQWGYTVTSFQNVGIRGWLIPVKRHNGLRPTFSTSTAMETNLISQWEQVTLLAGGWIHPVFLPQLSRQWDPGRHNYCEDIVSILLLPQPSKRTGVILPQCPCTNRSHTHPATNTMKWTSIGVALAVIFAYMWVRILRRKHISQVQARWSYLTALRFVDQVKITEPGIASNFKGTQFPPCRLWVSSLCSQM